MDGRQLDKILSSPAKFGIVAEIIAAGGTASFVNVARNRKLIGGYGALSRHKQRLEAEGYITQRRLFENNRAKTLLIVTDKGKRQFAEHCAALRAAAALAA